MNLNQAIQKAITDYGVDILKDRRFVSVLSEWNAFGQLPYAANMLRQIYANGYGTKVHKLYLIKDKTETAKFLLELRNKFGITEKDPMEIYVDGSSIILKKYEPNCIFCGNSKKLLEYEDKLICEKCAEKISKLNKN